MVDPTFVERRTTVVTLGDGTRVKLRPVIPEDRQRLQEGFERLSTRSRFQRFFTTMTRLSPAMLSYLTEIDYVDHFAVAAFVLDEPGEPPELGVGVARYIRLRDRPDAAEAAVAVVDDYQGRGIGFLLLEALALVAIENGVTTFVNYVLRENTRMLALFERLGGRAVPDEPGVYRVELDLPSQIAELRASPLYAALRALAAPPDGEGRRA